MKRTMTISIVTINYNDLIGLKNTVESVLNQQYSDIEYIIIDGGSTDGSKEFIQQLNDAKIAYRVSERDGGLYDAMNKGLKVATGEYVLFMNSGDRFFKPTSLKHLADEAKSSHADVIYGSALYAYPKGYVLRNPQSLKAMSKELPFCHQAVMVKTSLAKSRPFNTNLRLIADYDMFYHLWKSGHVFKEVENIISVYDASGVSASKANSHRIFEEQCIVHSIKPSEYAYMIARGKSSFRNIVRSIIPVGIRNRMLGRKKDSLNLLPLEYFNTHFN